jgi:hypothetical protein
MNAHRADKNRVPPGPGFRRNVPAGQPTNGGGRHERETRANIARIISTARLIAKSHEFDASPDGAQLRRMAERTITFWTNGQQPSRR